jgi:hypothetical protein
VRSRPKKVEKARPPVTGLPVWVSVSGRSKSDGTSIPVFGTREIGGDSRDPGSLGEMGQASHLPRHHLSQLRHSITQNPRRRGWNGLGFALDFVGNGWNLV